MLVVNQTYFRVLSNVVHGAATLSFHAHINLHLHWENVAQPL